VTLKGIAVKILTIVDEHTRECSGGSVDYSITALDLADQLDVLSIQRRVPKALRMDNGPESTSQAISNWVTETDLMFISPGQHRRNGYVEFCNSRLRDECLEVTQFHSLIHARGIIGVWKEEYNTTRPHSSLGYIAPKNYADLCTH